MHPSGMVCRQLQMEESANRARPAMYLFMMEQDRL